MASLHERPMLTGPSRWRLHYRLAGKAKAFSFADEKTGRRWEGIFNHLGDVEAHAMLVREYAPEVPEAAPVPTVRDVVEEHIAKRPAIEDGTRESYRREAARDIYPYLGSLPITALDPVEGPDIISEWINDLLEKPLAPKTVANRHGLLSGALKRAVRRKLIPANPCEGQQLPDPQRDPVVVLSLAQWWTLHDAITPHWRPLLSVLIGTGLRFSEATAIRVRDIDLKAGRLTVSRAWKYHPVDAKRKAKAPKSAAGRRVVPFQGHVADVLAPLIEGKGPDDLVFVNTRGTRIKYSSWRQPWSDALTKAGLPFTPRPHDLRHTYAAWQLASGKVSIYTLSKVLGHTSVDFTSRVYGHLLPGSLDDVAAAGELRRQV